MKKLLFLLFIALFGISCAEKSEPVTLIKLTTKHGDIKLKLFNETPLHRDNFIKLVNEGFYDDILFHRIIEGFMIQTGGAENRGAYTEGSDLSAYRYTLPAEIDTALFHRKGAVAAARMGDNVNPLRNSSGTQFYIVQGKVWDAEGLAGQEERIYNSQKQNLYFRYMAEEKARLDSTGVQLTPAEIQQLATLRVDEYFDTIPMFKIPDHHKAVYMSEGGTPHLDMSYTVFGQVIEGMEVIDMIAAEERDDSDRPLAADLRILKAEIVKK
jgi:cyclophilin family peptidyl-prolyl cis-trans isomerase